MQNFNFHSHTYRCGHSQFDYTDEEYALDYINNGFKKMAFTDHAPEKHIVDTRNHMRMGYEQRREYYNSINQLKEKYADKIEIESGFEIEYLPNQVEDMLELKGETDKLILGQHFVYAQNNKDLVIFWEGHVCEDADVLRYGEYVEEAMRLGIPDIIAHPDICFSGRESFGEVEEKTSRKICEASKKYDIPLEINLNGIFTKTYYRNREFNNDSMEKQIERLSDVRYPCKDFWKIASEYNVKALYGLDTHIRGYIPLYNNLVTLSNVLLGEDVIKKLNFVEKM